MRATRTLPSLALAGALVLGAAACGDDADPVGDPGEEQMTDEMTDDDMTEDMTDDDMTEDMTEEDMTEDMTDEMTDEG